MIQNDMSNSTYYKMTSGSQSTTKSTSPHRQDPRIQPWKRHMNWLEPHRRSFLAFWHLAMCQPQLQSPLVVHSLYPSQEGGRSQPGHTSAQATSTDFGCVSMILNPSKSIIVHPHPSQAFHLNPILWRLMKFHTSYFPRCTDNIHQYHSISNIWKVIM